MKADSLLAIRHLAQLSTFSRAVNPLWIKLSLITGFEIALWTVINAFIRCSYSYCVTQYPASRPKKQREREGSLSNL